MSLFTILFFVLFSLLTLVGNVSAGQMSGNNFKITSSVIPGGGNIMSSSHFRLISSVGQPTPVDASISGDYRLDVGFWYNMLVNSVGDVNGDGNIDLADIVRALQIVNGQAPDKVITDADADDDGAIGLSEALYILRKLNE